MRDIVFHNRLEAESVARSCKHLEGSVECYYLVRQLDTHCECRHNPPIKGVYLAKKLSLQVNWLSHNGEVSIRGLVVSALGFQIGNALVVVHLPETFHTSLALQFS
jgi:hypothetical protein